MGKETTAGTLASGRTNGTSNTQWWAYPAEEIEFMPGKEFIDFKEIRGSRQAYTTLDGPFRATASVKGAVYPGAALAQFIYGTLGDVRVLGTDGNDSGTDPDAPGLSFGTTATNKAYEMVFSDGATIPNWSLERSDGRDGSATIVEQLKGCKVESLQFQANFGEKVDMTVQFQGAKRPQIVTHVVNNETVADPLTNAQIVYPASDITPLYFNRAAIKLGGVQFGTMKTVSFDMKNTITRQEVLNSTVTGNYTVSETVDSYKLFEGGMECTLTGTAVFESTDLYDKLISGATATMELWLASNTYADADSGDQVPYLLYFYWPKVKVSKASIPFKAGEVIESDVEFKVIYDPTATIDGWTTSSSAGVTGGSVFVKMISKVEGSLSNGVLRPSFY